MLRLAAQYKRLSLLMLISILALSSFTSLSNMSSSINQNTCSEPTSNTFLASSISGENIPQLQPGLVNLSAAVVVSDRRATGFKNISIVDTNRATAATDNPSDTYLGQQWGLTKMQAPQAWNITHGSSLVKIAILDSGIDYNHPDLAAKIVATQNFSDSFTSRDYYVHGTHLAGIAAAFTNNNFGIAGVGFDSVLMNVKVLGDGGTGDYTWIIKGITWAADNGANVINLSLASDSDSTELKEAIDYAWNKGAIIVAAAGNRGSSKIAYPAGYANCISVAATDANDRLYSFSDYGNWVSLAAPGESFSTITGGEYMTMEGTSMAAAYVSGLAGLAFSMAVDKNGDGKFNDEVRAAILNGCDDIGISGIGKGRINAYKTIASLMPAPASVPLPSH